MKVGFVQFDVKFGQKDQNISNAFRLMSQEHADLWVLPELFNTGYSFVSENEVADLAEEIPSGRTTESLTEFALSNRCAVVAGLAERFGDTIYNSAILITDKGVKGIYRKIHLFDKEKNWFKPGDLPLSVWDVNGTKIGMMICFDWIFPEAARTLALKDAEIICHPSNLVLPYCQNAMITRCLENAVFAVTTNRIGTEKRGDSNLTFTGGSQITGTRGELLYRAGTNTEECHIVSINPKFAKNKAITDNNHTLNDRRPDMYELDG